MGGRCSLRQGEDRNAFSAEVVFAFKLNDLGKHAMGSSGKGSLGRERAVNPPMLEPIGGSLKNSNPQVAQE